MASRRDLLDQPKPRRFQLYRREDVNGMSGTGIVAEGIEYRDGRVAYRWLTEPSTTQFANSIHDVTHIHGHNGRTTVRWIDDPHPPGGEGKTISEVYEDRNVLALAAASLSDEIAALHGHLSDDLAGMYRGGWHPPQDDDTADADEWAVVWSTLPTGQVSWHVPRELAKASDLPQDVEPWDGHTRREKNNRLLDYVRNNW